LRIQSLLFTLMLGTSLLLAVIGSNGNLTIATRANEEATSTVTIGTSLTTSQSQPQQLIKSGFKLISTTGTNLQCQRWNFTFTGVQGQYVSGNFTSDIPLDFYLVQDSRYQGWLTSGNCGNAEDAIVSTRAATSYHFGNVLPNSGNWDLVLVNFSNSRDADGTIVAYVSSGSYTITQLLFSTVTTTIQPASTTIPSTSTAATVSPTNIQGFPIGSIAIGLMAGLVALLLLRHRRLRRR
jgi:hypothetical protein